jgi:hypothetical protein
MLDEHCCNIRSTSSPLADTGDYLGYIEIYINVMGSDKPLVIGGGEELIDALASAFDAENNMECVNCQKCDTEKCDFEDCHTNGLKHWKGHIL